MENRKLRVGSLFLWVVLCLQAIYSAFLVFGKIAVGIADKRALTHRGFHNFLPERELPIYALGVFLTLAIVVVSGILAKRGAKSLFMSDFPYSASTENFRVFLGFLSTLFFAFVFLFQCNSVVFRLSTPLESGKILAGSCFVAWAFTLFAMRNEAAILRIRLNRFGSHINDQTPTPHSNENENPSPSPHFSPGRSARSSRTLNLCFDIAVPILLFLAIFIPHTNVVAGADFVAEQLHHIDYFFMAPSLGYAHGGALGTEVYCQYGLGYPVLFSILARFAPLTYSSFLTFSVLYGWLYYVGVYLFFRILLKRPEWATLGVLLALSLQLFQGVHSPDVLWQFPSSTIMRSPADIWFLSALALHCRSKNRIWLFIAAFCTGLAVFFETDTGAYLLLGFGIYLALSKLSEVNARTDARTRIRVFDFALCGGIFAITLGAGLSVASRGSIFSPAFFSGWLEVFRLYPSGISMIPIIASQEALCVSFLFLLTYLLSVSCALHDCLASKFRRESPLIACISLYGICYLLQFIGRSHPFNLYHASIPLSLLLVWHLFKGACTLQSVLQFGGDGVSDQGSRISKTTLGLQNKTPVLIPICAIAILAMALLNNDAFRSYPNLLNSRSTPKTSDAPLFLLPETSDIVLPGKMKKYAEDFQEATQEAGRLSRSGRSVMFVVNNEPIYHLASGSKTPWRYSPMLPALMSKAMRNSVIAELEKKPADYAFIPQRNEKGESVDIGNVKDTGDSIAAVSAVIRSRYAFLRNSGRFEVWGLKNTIAAAKLAATPSDAIPAEEQ